MKSIRYGLMSLGTLLAFCVSWVLVNFWKRTFGAIFVWLGNKHVPGTFGHGPKPFGFLLGLNDRVQDLLGATTARTEQAMVAVLHQFAGSLLGLAHEIGALAESVERALVGFALGTLPKKIRDGVAFLWTQVKRLPALIKKVNHLFAWIERRIQHAVARAIGFALHGLGKLGKLAARPLALLWHKLTALAKRLWNLERRTYGKKWLALLHWGLTQLHLGWLFLYHWKWVGFWLTSWSLQDVIEFAKDAVRFTFDENICAIGIFAYDVAVYVIEPVVKKNLALTAWVCRGNEGDWPTGVKKYQRYAKAWEPSGTPPEAVQGRFAPHIPLPAGVRQED